MLSTLLVQASQEASSGSGTGTEKPSASLDGSRCVATAKRREAMGGTHWGLEADSELELTEQYVRMNAAGQSHMEGRGREQGWAEREGD